MLELIDEKPPSSSSSSKKNQRRRILNRPIICICNDLYAPALRVLRQKALIFKLDRPQTSRLVTRLMHICHKEGLQADAHTLSALCELADNDIRSCLNTLQVLYFSFFSLHMMTMMIMMIMINEWIAKSILTKQKIVHSPKNEEVDS